MVKFSIVRSSAFLISLPFVLIILALIYNYGQYSLWNMGSMLLFSLIVLFFLCFSESSIGGKLGVIFCIIVLFIPVFFCSNLLSAQTASHKPALELTIESRAFLTPAITVLKPNFEVIGGFFGNIIENSFGRIFGWRDLAGNLQCTYFLRYAWVGLWVAIWLLLFWVFYFSSLPGVGPGSFPKILRIWLTGDYSILPFGSVIYNWSRKTSVVNADKPTKFWLFRIADNWKKFAFTIIIYAYIMSFVPILNQVIKVISLEIFQPNWFIQSIVIAFEIGLLPVFVQQLAGKKARMKAYKKELSKMVYRRISENSLEE
jgi:hypothetical protein